MKPSIIAFAMAILLTATSAAQDIVTAADFFNRMQEKYLSSPDYEASLTITQGKSVMQGVIAYRAPNLLRIDFSQPAGQVLCFNGEELTIYLPEYGSVLKQAIQGAGGSGAGMATGQGLSLLKRNFTVAYDSSTGPVPLEEGSAEQVIKLRLEPRAASEGYRKIILSVNPDTKLIRRMEGETISRVVFVYDFRDIRLNQGIPATRFIYDSPASANLYNNFLFKTE